MAESYRDARVQSTANLARERFQDLGRPGWYEKYQEIAEQAGVELAQRVRLAPHVLVQYTTIRTDLVAPLTGIPVSLSSQVPQQTLQFYFQDPAFIRRVTATVTGLRLLQAGQPDVELSGSFDAGDYIYAQLRRAGAGDVFFDKPMPLSEFTGKGWASYFYDLVPFVRQAETLALDLSIVPPGNTNLNAPPFVDHVGLVNISFHTQRLAPWGM